MTLKIRSQYRNEWRENEFMLYLTEQNIRERYNIYRIRKKKKKTEFVILKTLGTFFIAMELLNKLLKWAPETKINN